MFGKKPEGKTCPLLKGACIGAACMWSTRIQGQNPNTGEQMDKEGCAVAWLPVLLVENAQQLRGVSTAVESFRNETGRAEDAATSRALAVLRGFNQVAERFTGALKDMNFLPTGRNDNGHNAKATDH